MRVGNLRGRVVMTGLGGALAVALAAGTGTATAQPAEPANAPGDGPVVTTYGGDWESVEVPVDDGEDFDLPTQFHGVIGVPDGAGPHPVVVLVHGSAPVCEGGDWDDHEEPPWPCPDEYYQRNDIGFEYLVEHLAAEGFLAVSVDVNAALPFRFEQIEERFRAAAVIDRHLDALQTAADGGENPFGVDVSGADLSRLGMLGHSRGGAWAHQVYLDRRAEDVSVDALALVAPVRPAMDQADEVDVPTAVVLPECDGDVSSLEGQHYYQLARDGGAGAMAVKLTGAGHNGFNTAMRQDHISNFRSDIATCDDEDYQMPVADHPDWLAQFVTDFWDPILTEPGGPMPWDGREPLPGVLYGQPAQSAAAAPAADRTEVPLADAEGVGAELRHCTVDESQRLVGCGSSLEQSYAGGDELTMATWTEPGAALRLPVPADPAAGTSPAEAVSLRFVPDPTTDLNSEGKPKTVSITATDDAGNQATVDVEPTQPALVPPIATFSSSLWTTNLAPGTIRLPMESFAGVDPAALDELRLELSDETGQVLVGEVDVLH